MIVVDEETGEECELRETLEYSHEIRLIYEQHRCDHPELEIRKRAIKGGFAYYMQCLRCGQSRGGAVSKNAIQDISQVPDFDPGISERWDGERAAKVREVQQRYLRIQMEENHKRRKEYNEYLDSPEWKFKRGLVMKRSGGTCEGCGILPAEQVHHLTYHNFGNEFLWELVAVCRPCHERVHGQDEEPFESHEEGEGEPFPDDQESAGFESEESRIAESDSQEVRKKTDAERKAEIEAEFNRIMAELGIHSTNEHTKRDQS